MKTLQTKAWSWDGSEKEKPRIRLTDSNTIDDIKELEKVSFVITGKVVAIVNKENFKEQEIQIEEMELLVKEKDDNSQTAKETEKKITNIKDARTAALAYIKKNRI